MESFITEKQFTLLYGDSKELVFILEYRNGKFVYQFVNPSALLVFPNNPVGKSIEEAVSPKHAEELLTHYREALGSNVPYVYQDFFIFSDIELVNETTLRVIHDEGRTFIFAKTREVSGDVELKEKYNFLQSILNMNVDPTVVLSPDGKIYDMNPQFEKTFGCKLLEWRGKHYLNLPFLPENEKGPVAEYFEKNKTGNNAPSRIVKRKKAEGKIATFLVSYSPIIQDQSVVAIYILMQEIEDETALRNSFNHIVSELRSIERIFHLITENTTDFIVITNDDGMIQYSSPSHEKRLGYEQEELSGHFFDEIVSDDCNISWSRDILPKINDGEEIRLEIQLLQKNGHAIWTETSVISVEDPTRESVNQLVIVSREITERKKLEERLRFLAYHDNLTHLPNRSFLLKEFPKIAEQAYEQNTSIGILYLDGDDFKEVNDSYGHEVGDEFIRHFGLAVQASIRTNDVIARIGGDEFVILLTNLTTVPHERKQQVISVIERIQQTLTKGWSIRDSDFHPTSSIGISFYPENGTTLDELLEKADHALYEVKRMGKNKFLIFNEIV
ncbi:diguanylate cyclase domain-containing protein [Paenisporosarcina cavernae]|uniref:Sensor domain-containing diguanylate cyclase n=1 Tax=Paenisporosarcina cavernae TaxID=2320858 RepID=A0A385YUU5_9BACL|nr:diguanylate cyclase [Paenisporosarcina cavernae]AYC29458.1 sensor domain-containing diguanylate cyclase [Paenisporosarcina cavernae]